MKKLFKKYNKLYFNNCLLLVDIFIEQDDSTYGYFDSNEMCIYLSPEYPREIIEATLLHEMVHLWQLDFDSTVNWVTGKNFHGKYFKQFENFIYLKDGIKI